jgi:hypothetical protein
MKARQGIGNENWALWWSRLGPTTVALKLEDGSLDLLQRAALVSGPREAEPTLSMRAMANRQGTT